VTRVVTAYTLPVDAVPAFGGALWPVTFLIVHVITNVSFARPGMWRILLGKDGQPPAAGSVERPPRARPGGAELQPQT
jgi:hypothetical protein